MPRKYHPNLNKARKEFRLWKITTSFLTWTEVSTNNKEDASPALEITREAKSLSERATYGMGPRGNSTKDDNPPIFDGQTAIHEGIYPQNTIVTYEFENVDLFESFDHEAGKFLAPFDGELELRFEYTLICRLIKGAFHIRKNVIPIDATSCVGPDGILPGQILTFISLVRGDIIEVYTGTADLISVDRPMRITGYWPK